MDFDENKTQVEKTLVRLRLRIDESSTYHAKLNKAVGFSGAVVSLDVIE